MGFTKEFMIQVAPHLPTRMSLRGAVNNGRYLSEDGTRKLSTKAKKEFWGWNRMKKTGGF